MLTVLLLLILLVILTHLIKIPPERSNIELMVVSADSDKIIKGN